MYSSFKNAIFSFLAVFLFIINEGYSSPSPSIRVKRDDYLRCKISESICNWSCRLAGHSGGFCTPEGNGDQSCICSEEDLDRYVCSDSVGRQLGSYACAGFCQAKGRQSGNCDISSTECKCSKEYLELNNIKCINDEVCSLFCQFREKKANGKCGGPNNWDCKCISNETEERFIE